MAMWTSQNLSKIGNSEEIEITSRRADGTLRKPVIIWVVRHGDDLYVRSVKGRDGAWFRGTQETHEGRISSGGAGEDVTFAVPETDIDDELDDAYRTKYGRYAGRILNSILTPAARATTTKLEPHSTRGASRPDR